MHIEVYHSFCMLSKIHFGEQLYVSVAKYSEEHYKYIPLYTTSLSINTRHN